MFIVYLLSPHSDPDADDLYDACIYNNLDHAVRLLHEGVDPNHSRFNRVGYRFTPLHWASIWNNTKIIHPLIRWGAELDAVDRNGNSPLHYACSNGSLQATQLLVEEGCCTG